MRKDRDPRWELSVAHTESQSGTGQYATLEFSTHSGQSYGDYLKGAGLLSSRSLCHFAASLIGLTIVTCGFCEGVPPPQAPPDEINWSPISQTEPAPSLRLGKLLVRFEDTTFAEILQTAARGNISHRGDAGGTLYWLCYSDSASGWVDRIWIMAGEMGGSEHEVGGVAAQRILGGHANTECPELPKAMKPVSLVRGLWLNTPAVRVSEFLGKPSHVGREWEAFSYQGKVAGLCEGNAGLDLTDNLFLQIDHGRVRTLYAWRVTSC